MTNENSAPTHTPLGHTREDIAAMIAEKTLLKRAPSLLEVGNVAALMASERQPNDRHSRQHDLRHDRGLEQRCL